MGREADTKGYAELLSQAVSRGSKESTGSIKCKFCPNPHAPTTGVALSLTCLKFCLTNGQYEWFVQFYSAFEDTDYVYIAMEYIPIRDISKTFVNGYRWNESDTKVVIKQLLQGLAVMHKEGITHRDLKPEVCTPPPRTKRRNQNLIVTRAYPYVSQRISRVPSM